MRQVSDAAPGAAHARSTAPGRGANVQASNPRSTTMKLEGSCHCKAVRFTVEAPSPVPFMRCYCSICRKTAGGGGYAINLGAARDTLRVDGEDALSVYRARLAD